MKRFFGMLVFIGIYCAEALAAPTVSLTAPTNGNLYLAPATFAVKANASAPGVGVNRVEFYANGNLIGTDTTSPYQFDWTAAAGSYAITAKAVDNNGAETTSASRTVTVSATNANPTVSLTAPADNARYLNPASVTLSATASGPELNDLLQRVDFLINGTLVGTATSAPYSFAWPSPALGTYTLTAVAVDGQGASTTSAPRTFIVTDQNQAPTVSIVTPLDNSRWHSPASFMFQANASAGEANDIVRVEFYVNNVLQGQDTTSPYSINLSSLAAGTYVLTAKAIDGQNAETTSAARTITVSDTNNPPTVSITAPANNANFATAPGTFTLSASANAGEVNGSVAKVEFYVNGALVNTDTAGPFSYPVSGLAHGVYTLTAKAFDQLNAETLSAPVTVTVGPQPKLHFIHVDHLNTPRLIADQAGTTVWRHDNTEPFGDSVPDENPSGLGVFENPLGFAGTYRDKEIGGKLFNWSRAIDPALGRYLQSDLAGLNGGLNTYLHLGGNPLSKIDLMGFAGDTLEGGKGGRPPIGFPDVSGQAGQSAAQQLQKMLDKLFCPPDCADIQQQIDASIVTLRVRYLHMTADVNNLYCLRPTGKFSWLGHQFAYNNERKHLEKLVAQAKQRGCPYDPEAEDWIRRDPPTCPAR